MDKFVLIGGMPRSGTNLARRIIGSHSEIAIPPSESKFFRQYIRGKSVTAILTRRKMGNWNVDFSDLYSRGHREVFIAALMRYAENVGKSIPGEKSPYNEFYYDIIQEWLNDFELKFVHVMRNPFDATASYKHFRSATPRKRRKRTPPDISAHSRNWVRSVSLGLARAHYNPEGYYLLKYEDLATDPIGTTQELCAFLEVDFEKERMLNLSDFEGHRDNTSFSQDRGKEHGKYSAIRKPKSRKQYLTDSEIRIVSSTCGELAQALGYHDDDFGFSPHESTNLNVMTKLRRMARNFLLSGLTLRRGDSHQQSAT